MVDRYSNRESRSNSRKTSNLLAPQGSTRQNNCQSNCQGNTSCPNGNSCQALRHRLQALDFSIIDTVLYLDAHPNSSEALAHYHTLVSERDTLKQMLSKQCHMPVTHCDNTNRDNWEWINNPWPWELGANE